MNQGDRCTYMGNEVALLPFDYINISQVSGPSSLTHCCGHAADFTFPTVNYPAYAPFTCTLFQSDTPANGNRRSYVSDAPVWTVSHGLVYVTVSFTHDDNPPAATHFNQGDIIMHSGTAGYALGDHTHMDQAPAQNDPLVSYGITCSGGNLCYALQSSVEAEDIFYTAGTETVIDTHGKTFTDWTGSPITPGGNFKWWMSAKLLRRRKYGI